VGAEYEVNPEQVLRPVDDSRCSAYDCEFIVLARDLGVPMIASDRQLLREFPDAALSMEDFTR
jgi:predicted nucleic acid-binding protein